MQDMVYIYIAKMNIRRCKQQGQAALAHGPGSFKHGAIPEEKPKHHHWADLQNVLHKECDSIELNIVI